MSILTWLAVGGLIGWAGSALMCTDTQKGLLLNVALGIVGAFLGGWLLSDFFGSSTIDQGNISMASVVVSYVGAIVLIGLLTLVRRT